MTSCDEMYEGSPRRMCNSDGTWGPVQNPCTRTFLAVGGVLAARDACRLTRRDRGKRLHWPRSGQCVTAQRRSSTKARRGPTPLLAPPSRAPASRRTGSPDSRRGRAPSRRCGARSSRRAARSRRTARPLSGTWAAPTGRPPRRAIQRRAPALSATRPQKPARRSASATRMAHGTPASRMTAKWVRGSARSMGCCRHTREPWALTPLACPRSRLYVAGLTQRRVAKRV